ncbi:uncharacterized protein PRCAT00003122001 [Priceomyces carsonii]|uniref:uncharacterized protein n=1 Tax=Priceomyces carsonii TaxID=28549 RepID=UPI002EDA89E1|nr:unnamed protein product [Priceomyces carsonii]
MLFIRALMQSLPTMKNCSTNLILRRTFFGTFFKGWGGQRIIYPPAPEDITTNNRLYPVYISNRNELHDIILAKEPLILNFTYADPKSNRISQSLFDILADKNKYPLDFPVNLANIWADTPGGRELMLTYVVGKIPTLVLLKKQILVDSYVPNSDNFREQDLRAWLSQIKQ